MRDVFGIFVMATIAIGLAIAAWAHISERLEARARRKAHGGDSHDPASCSHDWVVCESGTCMTDYSSVGATRRSRGTNTVAPTVARPILSVTLRARWTSAFTKGVLPFEQKGYSLGFKSWQSLSLREDYPRFETKGYPGRDYES